MGTPELSPRQRECVTMVSKSYPRRCIAAILGIAIQTVDEHMSTAGKKLGVWCFDVATATRYAIGRGWAEARFKYA